MARKKRTLLIFLINCMIFGLAYGLIGKNVRDIEAHDHKLLFSVSIAERASSNITDHRDFVNRHFCTGTLVSHKSIVTAAHCLLHKHVNQIEIIAGSMDVSKGSKYDVESWLSYDKWNRNRTTQFPLNNIAVIIVAGEGIRHENIRLAPILTVNDEYLRGREIRIVGWGKMRNKLQPNVLKRGTLKVLSNEECSLHGTMLKAANFTVPPNYFCSQAKPWIVSTPGDGGAPVINKSRNLVGINIGVCPKVEGYPEDTLRELELNCHLNFHYYKDFLKDALIM